MRKLKLFLLLFVVAVSAFCLTSCKDDDDKGGDSSIVGTWTFQEDGFYDSFMFRANGEYTNEWREDDGKSGSDYGTYTYDGSTLTMHSQAYGWADTSRATISGNRLIFDYSDGATMVYIRQ